MKMITLIIPEISSHSPSHFLFFFSRWNSANVHSWRTSKLTWYQSSNDQSWVGDWGWKSKLIVVDRNWFNSLIFDWVFESMAMRNVSRENPNRSYAELQNPLFVHPSDGPGSVDTKIKLIGLSNSWSWKWVMEITLTTKRKLPFIYGTITRPEDDLMKGQWDACNNLVIAQIYEFSIWFNCRIYFAHWVCIYNLEKLGEKVYNKQSFKKV